MKSSPSKEPGDGLILLFQGKAARFAPEATVWSTMVLLLTNVFLWFFGVKEAKEIIRGGFWGLESAPPTSLWDGSQQVAIDIYIVRC